MLYNKRKMALDPKPYHLDECDIVDIDDSDIKIIKSSKRINEDNNNRHTIILKRKIAPRNGRYRKAIARRRREN